MLAVPLPEKELRTLLGGELDVAATNGPTLCVASGPFAAIDRLDKSLSAQGVETRRLHTSHAFHSAAMDPILRAFTERVARVRLQSPRIPYVSNVTGTWILAEEATDPTYWAKHLRRTVRFAEGLGELLSRPDLVLLEVGPGQTLSGLARQHPLAGAEPTVFASARSPREDRPDQEVLSNALARLWLSGLTIDWHGYYGAERRRRVPLPTYPFERQRFWIDTSSSAPRRDLRKKADVGDWFYVPTWKATATPRGEAPVSRAQPGPWLLFTPALGLGSKLASGLEAAGVEVLTVRPGERFVRTAERAWEIQPGCDEDYRSLIAEVLARGTAPAGIAHLWSLSTDGEGSAVDRLEASKRLGFYSLLFLAQALSRLGVTQPLQLAVVSNGIRDVSGAEATVPEKALLLGACRVIPQEQPNVTCRSIDVVLPPSGSAAEDVLLEQLLAELTGVRADLDVAYRGWQRWAEGFEALRLDAPQGGTRVRQRGSYLITGGLGSVGLALAEHLARTAQARLALVGRAAVPPREEWERRLAEHPDTDPVRWRISKLRELDSLGAEVLCLQADVADERQMREALSRAEAAFGPLSGVIHAAGITDRSTLRPLSELDVAQCEDQFRPKVEGLLVLERLFGGKDLDFCLLTSSLSTVLGGLGLGAYAAANHFMDAFAHDRNRRHRRPWLVVDWDGWNLGRPAGPATGADAFSMDAQQGVETFARVLSASAPRRLVVSTADLTARIERWVSRVDGPAGEAAGRPPARPAHVRAANAPYVAPRNDAEVAVAAIWQALFGIDEIGIHDNFFDLGGHSLLALQLTARLRELAHIDVKLQEVFNAPTVSELAALIGSSAVVADEAVAKLEHVLRMVEDLPEAEVQALLSGAAEPRSGHERHS
jgi:acyl transferase domain-containing protein